MRLLFCFISLCLAAATSLTPNTSSRSRDFEVTREKRLAHGQHVQNSPPWFAAIANWDARKRKYHVICSAVILQGLETVLAAAHCFDAYIQNDHYRKLTVFAGFQQGLPQQERKITQLRRHNFYATTRYQGRINDVALAALQTPFQRVPGLVNSGDISDRHRRPAVSMQPCRYYGMGRTESLAVPQLLQEVRMQVISASNSHGAHSCIRRLTDMVGQAERILRRGGTLNRQLSPFLISVREMLDNNKFCAEMLGNPEPQILEGDDGGPYHCDATPRHVEGLYVQSYRVTGRAIHIFTHLNAYKPWVNQHIVFPPLPPPLPPVPVAQNAAPPTVQSGQQGLTPVKKKELSKGDEDDDEQEAGPSSRGLVGEPRGSPPRTGGQGSKGQPGTAAGTQSAAGSSARQGSRGQPGMAVGTSQSAAVSPRGQGSGGQPAVDHRAQSGPHSGNASPIYSGKGKQVVRGRPNFAASRHGFGCYHGVPQQHGQSQPSHSSGTPPYRSQGSGGQSQPQPHHYGGQRPPSPTTQRPGLI